MILRKGLWYLYAIGTIRATTLVSLRNKQLGDEGIVDSIRKQIEGRNRTDPLEIDVTGNFLTEKGSNDIFEYLRNHNVVGITIDHNDLRGRHSMKGLCEYLEDNGNFLKVNCSLYQNFDPVLKSD